MKKSKMNLDKRTDNFLCQKGFGLVEVILAFGLLGLLSLGLMKLMENQAKAQRTTETKARISEILTVFRQTLSDLEGCNATLTGVSPGGTIPEIRSNENLSQEPFVRVGEEVMGARLTLTSLRLLTRAEEETRGLRKVSSLGSVLNSQGTGFAYLEVELTRMEGESRKTFGSISKREVIPVRAEFSNLLMITACDIDELQAKCDEELDRERLSQPNDCTIDMTAQQHQRIIVLTEPSTGAPKKFPIKGCGGAGYMAECKVFHPCLPISRCML